MVITSESFNTPLAQMKRLYRLLVLLFLAGSAYAGWKYRDPLLHFYRDHIAFTSSTEEKESPNPERYQELLADLSAKQKTLSTRYTRARTAREFSSVISESRRTLEDTLPEMMRCWLGTPWDFNGTCQTPGSGKIACGYFVSTILRDAGFEVERFRLAQQPSQNIIATFLPREEMHIRAGQPYADFLDQSIARGPGLRIVGLDNHVAFLVIPTSGEPRFIHSSGGAPKCVVDEDRENAHALMNSNYRVIGNLTRNDEVIHRWLTGQKWPTKL
jgi:hypothetical protein